MFVARTSDYVCFGMDRNEIGSVVTLGMNEELRALLD